MSTISGKSNPEKAKSRQHYTFSTWRHYFADSPLVPSGLLGQVKLDIYKILDSPFLDKVCDDLPNRSL